MGHGVFASTLVRDLASLGRFHNLRLTFLCLRLCHLNRSQKLERDGFQFDVIKGKLIALVRISPSVAVRAPDMVERSFDEEDFQAFDTVHQFQLLASEL